MHTYISKWTYLCMYTKMSLELVLQGLCRFFFFFFFILYKGFYLCCGFTVSAATGRRDTLFGWKLHNSSLIFSFKHKPAINTSPAQTRTHCWDHLDNMGDTRESFLLRHEWLGSFLLGFFFFSPLSDNSDGRATPGKLHSRPWNKCVKMCNHKECALCFSYEPHKSSLLATLSLS